eukprot:CAMPEP_0181231546 /NCGR_PEP_ID=MMETSP1096-20121128/35170_1 /TAXON_ID=156174 ORGANISM="Chrysochromulina ericina, Strain CCMP281" /NCGR_SAMPLE_ID=MMETSP1096 /ASSEMBLY_ACC=CAM_ASM_000453 /LENGTH=92 /DNA_ID=CAMNT_0023325607 /DNA_START=20 /DNA_END=294 /DNA_ORIENTATION=-
MEEVGGSCVSVLTFIAELSAAAAAAPVRVPLVELAPLAVELDWSHFAAFLTRASRELYLTLVFCKRFFSRLHTSLRAFHLSSEARCSLTAFA